MNTQLKTREDIKNFLQSEGVEYKEYSHREALPMEDWVAEFGKFDNAPFIKNLLFKDSKKGLHFIILEWQTKINDAFWQKLGSKKGNVRLANEDVLAKLEGIKGSTSFFNILNDKEKTISNLVFDQKL